MSLNITVVTTANRQRRFRQTDSKKIYAILGSLLHATEIFRKPMLVIVGDESTEIYNPSTITRIEFDTCIDLSGHLPTGWLNDPCLQTMPAETLDPEAQDPSKQFDFFFVGGDKLKTKLNTSDNSDTAKNSGKIAVLFEQAVIPYRLAGAGVGLINPVNLTRTRASAPLLHPPAGAWHAQEIFN